MAPSSKRQRCSSTASATSNDNAKDDVAAAAPASTVPSLQNFALLPNELRTRIVKLACRLPSSSSSTLDADKLSTTSSSATPGLDAATALSLVRVSRSLYAVVTPLIWSHVWITTASALASFHRAIAARPQLGRLVTNLHLGPDDQLPKWWYPLLPRVGIRPVVTTISHSLRSAQEVQLLPLWCDKDWDWTLTDSPADDCRDSAIHLALQMLQRSLDIDLTAPRWTMGSRELSIEEWTTRVYELRAGLELYLMGMRRVDDQHQRGPSRKARTCRGHEEQCSSYPPLLLTGTASSSASTYEPSNGAPAPLTISRHQLLRHLARPGSITDRLDHPLIFERSGIEMTHRVGKYGNGRFYDNRSHHDQQEDIADRFASSHAGAAHGAISPASFEVLDPSLPSTATLGSLLALARSVFSFTPLLRNLSLTGFLDRAVCGSKQVRLHSLRHLSIGPPPPSWFARLNFGNLQEIESLRICGVELCEVEAFEIADHLTSLKHFSWSLCTKWPSDPADRAVQANLEVVFKILRGCQAEPRSASSEDEEELSQGSGSAHSASAMADGVKQLQKKIQMAQQMRRYLHDVEDDESLDTTCRASPPLYEISLHPSDLQLLLDSAPNPEVRAAWTSGQVADAKDHCRLLLVESAAAAKGRWKGVSCTSSEELYKEGREWWERCAGL